MSELELSVEQLARDASASGVSIAVAESLTGGQLSACLAQLPDASCWYRGALVAYAAEVKHAVLAVPDVPVVSETSASSMAVGVAELLGADVAIAVTGVAGPGRQDGVDEGTVWFALHTPHGTQAQCRRFTGGPSEVVHATCATAVQLLAGTLHALRER